MKKRESHSARVSVLQITVAVVLSSASAVLLAASLTPSGINRSAGAGYVNSVSGPLHESQLVRAARQFNGDLRSLPKAAPVRKWRPEREAPYHVPQIYLGPTSPSQSTTQTAPAVPSQAAPAPAPSLTFDGLDFATWGGGHPPDPNGDVGPNHYIQVVNTSIGVFDKSTGARITAFRFDTFMSQGNFGNLCDTDNFGDPVVVYDTFEDRWIITDFAFQVDGSGNVINPPGAFQCFAVSKTGDPVSGGWNFYSLHVEGALNDYPKFGVWPDGLYMSANMFGYAATAPFQNVRVWALNKFQMYAGAPTVQVVSSDVADTSEFTLLPANARLQVGTPPAGTPNYFVSTWEFVNAQTVYKFHVDWNSISLSTFTGPFASQAGSSWPNQSVPNATTPGNNLDTLGIRAMAQNQYTNISGVESLWTCHTVRRATNGFAAPRWYQIPVTGGNVAANDTQSATWDPDGADVIYRYVPSLAVDRMGDMTMGYTTSNSTTDPGIKYAGRLSTDPVNTFSQTEQTLIQGTGTQTGNCGTSTCIRWGDYTAMTLDPNGCTFWYTNEYYAVDGLNDLTRIGSLKYSQCTPVGNGGTVQGAVTANPGGNPISGAAVAFGSRKATTDNSGFFSFSNIPAGTYPSITASAPGRISSTTAPVIVTDGGTTIENFALTAAPTNACLTDTTQADFQTGVPTNVDLTTSPGQVMLAGSTNLDQQNTTVGNFGLSITSTTWDAQTFVPAVSGQLTRVDADLFCSGCSGTNPDVTIDIRTTSGGLPTSTILGTTTIHGFSSGSGVFYSATFNSPPILTASSTYAIVASLVTDRTTGTYAWLRSNHDQYASGSAYQSVNSGLSWTAVGSGRDFGFKTYIKSGHAPSGNLISSAKDSNPAPGYSITWGALSWTATSPANTSVKFQAAASTDANGIFNFVGPDGTANTFFNNGGSLAQFNGFRYLKYNALLSTTDSTSTPTVNDVTVCFNDQAPSPVELVGVDSRMLHGSAGTFSVDLPTTGSPGIECRSGGANGDYTLIFTFSNTLTSVGSASVTSGTGSVASGNIDSSDAHNYIVSLTGATNAQVITVSLANVTDSAGNFSSAVSASMGVLVGDVNASGVVDGNDVSAVQSHTRQSLNTTNFPYDVNASGVIDGNDVSITQGYTRTSLP
jgi:hypothetical protein